MRSKLLVLVGALMVSGVAFGQQLSCQEIQDTVSAQGRTWVDGMVVVSDASYCPSRGHLWRAYEMPGYVSSSDDGWCPVTTCAYERLD